MSEEEKRSGRASEFVGGRTGATGRRGKIGRTLRGGSPATQEPAEDLGAAPRPPGGKPVRITVDLDAERHRRLKQYALDASTRGAPVIRALLDELDEDPELSARVQARLSAEA